MGKQVAQRREKEWEEKERGGEKKGDAVARGRKKKRREVRKILSKSSPRAPSGTRKPAGPRLYRFPYSGHFTCDLLCLASFTKHTVFKGHPCHSMHQYFIPFYS